MNVILLGYRGSGKTSIGRRLASQLWKTFVDTDAQACKRFNGKTIAEIWAAHGEAAWREAEAAVVAETLDKTDQVIALGGGTLMIPGMVERVKSARDCKRIYLLCEPEELHRRIAADAQTAAARPNLTTLGGGVDEVRSVLSEREPVYRAVADAEFDVTHVSVEEAALFLIRKFL